jgi:hypothetical protein
VGAGEHGEPAVAECGGDRGSVFEGDLVAVALEDERGSGHCGECAEVDLRLGVDHGQHLGVDDGEVLGSVGRERVVRLSEEVDCFFAAEQPIEVAVGQPSFGVVVLADEDHVPYEVRPAQRDQQGHHRAVAPTDQMRSLAPDSFEVTDGVGGHDLIGQRTLDIGRVGMPSPLGNVDAEAGAGQRRSLRGPRRRAGEAPVEEHDRGPYARHFVPGGQPTDVDVAGLESFDGRDCIFAHGSVLAGASLRWAAGPRSRRAIRVERDCDRGGRAWFGVESCFAERPYEPMASSAALKRLEGVPRMRAWRRWLDRKPEAMLSDPAAGRSSTT